MPVRSARYNAKSRATASNATERRAIGGRTDAIPWCGESREKERMSIDDYRTGRYDEDSSGGHLHLVAVLRAEVHLLQLRVRRPAARTGSALPDRAAERDRIAHLAMDARHRLPRRRNSQRHGTGPSRSPAERLPGIHGAKPPSKLRRARSPPNASRRGCAPASIASASACSRSSAANSRAPAGSIRPKLSRRMSPCCARTASTTSIST